MRKHSICNFKLATIFSAQIILLATVDHHFHAKVALTLLGLEALSVTPHSFHVTPSPYSAFLELTCSPFSSC